MGFDPIEVRLGAVRSLTKLLLHEIESLAEISAMNGAPPDKTHGNLHDKVRQYEVALICNALLESHGNQRKAAKQLGINTSTLHAKIKRHEIDALNLFGRYSDALDTGRRMQEME